VSEPSETGAGAVAPGRHSLRVDEAQAGARLDLLVAQALGTSRTQAATWIATDRVRVDGRPEKASFRAEPGATVVVDVPEPAGRAVVPEDLPLRVVYEDEDLLVVDKAAGMVVHPAPGNWSGTLVNALLGRGGPLSTGSGAERAGLVHRLDKETSGLLLVARSDRAHRALSADLAARRIVRRYAAVCWGHLAEDRLRIDAPLGRDGKDRRKVAIMPSGRPARTDVVRLARFASVDLLRCHLHTGRTHQIRVHLASLGHPVVGDDTYGGGGGRKLLGLPPQRHFLHAAWLRFRHPVSGAVHDVRSPLPPDLHAALARAAEDPALATAADPLADFGFFREDG
jgi:23S rRNA pseudouridine1911/1915/1917 synthase